jgi:hypothetical protein
MTDEKTEEMDQFKAAAERVRTGETESEDLDLPSGRVRLIHDPNAKNGMKIEVLETHPGETSREGTDPKSLEAMERVKEVMGRFKAGDLDSAEIPLPTGETMHLTRDDRSPGAFTIRSPEGGPNMLSIPFDPSPSRPETYPDDLPFIAETSAAYTELEGGEGEAFRTLTWFISHDPTPSLQELRAQLAAAGWDEMDESSTSTAFGNVTSIEFVSGEKKRAVVLSRYGEHSQLKLFEHPIREEE